MGFRVTYKFKSLVYSLLILLALNKLLDLSLNLLICTMGVRVLIALYSGVVVEKIICKVPETYRMASEY